MKDIHSAAARLQKRLNTRLPSGSANTLAFTGPGGAFLRVLVDFPCKGTKDIPTVFDGFKVVVERRPLVTPFQ